MGRVVIIFFVLCTIFSCSKEEGTGGLASIEGKVFGYYINKNGVVLDSAYIGEHKVFISYGEDTFVDDEVRTSFTGHYKFAGLTKGEYTIAVYSNCKSCPFEKEAITMKVTLSKNNESFVLPDFKIFEQ